MSHRLIGIGTGFLCTDGLYYFFRKILLRKGTRDALFLIDNGMRNATDVIFYDEKGKLGARDHIGGDIIVCHGKSVSGANRTGTVRSGGRNKDLQVNRFLYRRQYLSSLFIKPGGSFPHIQDILDKNIKFIPGGDTVKADTIVFLP